MKLLTAALIALAALCPAQAKPQKAPKRAPEKVIELKLPTIHITPWVQPQPQIRIPAIFGKPFKPVVVRPELLTSAYQKALARLAAAQQALRQATNPKAARKALDEINRATMGLRRALWKAENGKIKQPKPQEKTLPSTLKTIIIRC